MFVRKTVLALAAIFVSTGLHAAEGWKLMSGKRTATLTNYGQIVMLNRRSVKVWLEWMPHPRYHDIDVCQLMMQAPGQNGATEFAGLATINSTARTNPVLYIHENQAIRIYDIATVLDADGCWGGFKFDQSASKRGFHPVKGFYVN